MARTPYRKHKARYVPGDYKVRSDESGLTVMDSDTRLTWEGYKVARSEWDPKHPQLILYPRSERVGVNNPRPTSENDADLPWGEGNANDL
jgi:hypothetical protein